MADLIDDAHRSQVATWLHTVAPTSFGLGQNFPNPFNPETTLRLQMQAEDTVTLVIFDATGQAIRTLMHAALPAGIHTLHWDGRDGMGRQVGSGTYFARLQGSGWQAERKMLLLR
jgi:hypothetical protein